MRPLRGDTLCFRHSPRTVHQRRAASARGGRHNRTPKASSAVAVASIADLQRHVGQALADVLLRDNTERRANAVARLVEVARRLIEVGEVEDRMNLIEQRLAWMERGG